MKQILVRMPVEIKELIRYEALRLGISQNTLINEVLTKHLTKNRDSLLEIKNAVVSARGKGRRSSADSQELAKKIAELDDAEGLGTIKVQKRNRER